MTPARRYLVSWLAVAFALAQVTLAQPPQAQPPASVSAADVRSAADMLPAITEEILGRSGVPGMSVVVVYNDEIVFLSGFGVREAGSDEPVTGDTVFQIASLSKPVASTVVAALVGSGALEWDDPVADLLPGFRLGDPWLTSMVTVRDLFAHRSGIHGDAGNDLEILGYGRDEILERLRHAGPGAGFRDGYFYSNYGMTAGGVAAAAGAGLSWEEAARQYLYEPLGMSSSSSRHEDFVARQNRASLHIPVAGEWRPELQRQPDPQSPAGGVSSSARDMGAWLRLQMAQGSFEDEQVVEREALLETHEPHIFQGFHPITGSGTFYGLGWNVSSDEQGRVRLAHAGAFSVGARSYASLIPQERLGIIVLANAFPTGAPEAVADSFIDLVDHGELTRDWLAEWDVLYDALWGSFTAGAGAYAQPPEAAAPPLEQAAYEGVYRNDYFGEARVEASDENLTLYLGPDGATSYELSHWNRDTFIYYPSAELPELPSGATFTIGPDGVATSLYLEEWDSHGQGTFVRER